MVRISGPTIFHLSCHNRLDLVYHHNFCNQLWCKLQSFHKVRIVNRDERCYLFIYREIISHFSALHQSLSKQNPNISFVRLSQNKTLTSLSLVSLIWKSQTYATNSSSSKDTVVASNLSK